MGKIYKEESTGKYVYKTAEEYKGIKCTCKGSSRTCKSEAKENWKKNLEARKKKIDNVDSSCDLSVPLKKALPAWYELYHEHSWRTERTKHTDHDTISQICKSILGEFPVNAITSDHIQKYLISETSTLSKSSLKKRRNMLNMFFSQYRLNDNPVKRTELPTSIISKETIDAYNDEEIARLTEVLSAVYNPAIHANSEHSLRGFIYGNALIVCLFQYLRYSELTELRVKDINFDEGLIYVSRQYDEYTGEIKLPKYNMRIVNGDR
ncbi:hypothetical protein [Oribacterium sp. WCC10]|uniref:hypothetical protein n=1 Tax=Oribacterium sp. WCC10 TaxID=1855343 RepID=UPI0008F2312A|nr:hypothetical protein [Oribacterium sp. WCC10]SFG57593.1 hypothetical protein SAMN05216356_11394 [Oribacterium sp. WCC10]